MSFCQQCGKPLESDSRFCVVCGTRNEPTVNNDASPPEPMITTPPATYTAPSPPASPPSGYVQEKSGGKSSNALFITLAVLLGVVVIGLGAFLFIKINELNNARRTISDLEYSNTTLEANVFSLEGQLAAERANVTSLNTQLASERVTVTNLQAELTSAKGDLTSTQSALATAQTSISALEGELVAAEARVAALQADLTIAQANLSAATASNTALANDLNAVRSPRHFNSLQELTQWLANDDTDTNPAYATISGVARAYVLQVKALRDGYIISGYGFMEGSTMYYGNFAIAGSTVYDVDCVNDAVSPVSVLVVPLRPLS